MIICLADCPEEYGDDFEGIIRLIKAKGIVSFARTTGIIHDIIKYVDG